MHLARRTMRNWDRCDAPVHLHLILSPRSVSQSCIASFALQSGQKKLKMNAFLCTKERRLLSIMWNAVVLDSL